MLAETKESFDSHYEHQRADLENSVGKIDRFAKMMINLQQEMKSRDEALKKVPSNCAQILKELKSEMKVASERCDRVDEKFDDKVDLDAFEEAMDLKLDRQRFERVFPSHRAPADHLKQMIKVETQQFNQEIRNMVKLWDQKISGLRSELNIHGIYRKMGKFAGKEELAADLRQVDKKHEKLEGEIARL